jgi:hypothetical protein
MLRPRRSLFSGLTTAAALAAGFMLVPAPARARATHHRSAHAAKKAPHSKAVSSLDGKIAVFPVRYDEDDGFSAQLVRILKAHGLDVATDVRRVDTAEQFRELSTALGFAAYVDGEYMDNGPRSRMTILVRNGYTGRKVAAVTFHESNLHMRTEVEDKLWTKIGPALARACADASKPRKRDRDPLMIEAGTPLADK